SELANQLLGQTRRQRWLAAADSLEQCEECVRIQVLEDVALRAALDRLEQVRIVLRGGQNDHLDSGLLRAQQACRRKPVHLGHAQVHQHDVGREPLDLLERFAAVPGLADDIFAQPLPVAETVRSVGLMASGILELAGIVIAVQAFARVIPSGVQPGLAMADALGYPPAATGLSAARHALAQGFLLPVIVVMAARILPGYSGYMLRRPRLLALLIWTLLAGAALRFVAELLGGYAPGW